MGRPEVWMKGVKKINADQIYSISFHDYCECVGTKPSDYKLCGVRGFCHDLKVPKETEAVVDYRLTERNGFGTALIRKDESDLEQTVKDQRE